MENTLIEVERKLKKYGQEHLLNGYSKLDETKQKRLLEQINNIDFNLINSLYENTKKKMHTDGSVIEPIQYYDKYKLNEQYKELEAIGEKAIKEGQLAVVTMAGGQGTRLGCNGPKGTYDIGLESHKSLFELLSDSIKDSEKKYNVSIPWFIMTSEENNEETVEFFEKHKFFRI